MTRPQHKNKFSDRLPTGKRLNASHSALRLIIMFLQPCGRVTHTLFFPASSPFDTEMRTLHDIEALSVLPVHVYNAKVLINLSIKE